jgi:hypothetical protein
MVMPKATWISGYLNKTLLSAAFVLAATLSVAQSRVTIGKEQIDIPWPTSPANAITESQGFQRVVLTPSLAGAPAFFTSWQEMREVYDRFEAERAKAPVYRFLVIVHSNGAVTGTGRMPTRFGLQKSDRATLMQSLALFKVLFELHMSAEYRAEFDVVENKGMVVTYPADVQATYAMARVNRQNGYQGQISFAPNLLN